jgi:hypothetical protein
MVMDKETAKKHLARMLEKPEVIDAFIRWHGNTGLTKSGAEYRRTCAQQLRQAARQADIEMKDGVGGALLMIDAFVEVPEKDTATYEERILECWKHINSFTGCGASAAEITGEMSRRGWLSPADSVIDIADLMARLRVAGRL